MAAKEKDHAQMRGTCGFPTPENPYYHVRLGFSLEGDGRYQITRVKVNGQRVRDFAAYHDFRRTRDQDLRTGGVSELVVRWDWKPREHCQVEITGEGPREKQSFTLNSSVDSPASGGYWDPAWKHYASLVLTETAGLDRENEPVHASLAVYGDRIKDPERELRIVAVDPQSGVHQEVPSQVHEVARYSAEGMQIGEEYQPTTTFQFAFLADVRANSSFVYLAFYGNPGARSPAYGSGLSVSGENLSLAIENPYYRTILSPKSGAIDEIHVKMGVNQKIEHHLETNGALHWNPCFYCPPRPWLHASDWDPPPQSSWFGGPVFIATTRSGHVDPYKEESHMAVTYRFYDKVPWIFLSTKVEVRKDIATKALRNGEFVVNRKLVEEFAWRKPDGSAGTMLITDGPRHPWHAKVLPAETPWAAFFSRKGRFGLGMVNIKLADFKVEGGLPKLCNRYSYLQWGKWAYYARPLVYTFASNNPARLVPVSAGNVYYEEMAVVPLKIDPEKEDFQQLEILHEKLAHPLDLRLVEDTDPRAPEGWVPPVLVKEFEEMDDE
jgi:hypothetical protein